MRPSTLPLLALLIACHPSPKDNTSQDTGHETPEESDTGEGTDSDTGDSVDSETGDLPDTGDSDTGASNPQPTITVDGHTFNVYEISTLTAFSGIAIADVDADGQLDVVLSRWVSPTNPLIGGVTLHTWSGDLHTWTRSPIVAPKDLVPYPNEPALIDVDADGDLDMILPSGSYVCSVTPVLLSDCGALAWWEQDAGAWTPHKILSEETHNPFSVRLADIDGDGTLDIVTALVREASSGLDPETLAVWFAGQGDASGFDTTPHAIGTGLGRYPDLGDFDGDGDLDIGGAEETSEASFVWFEATSSPSADHPDGEWTRHIIAQDDGPSRDFRWVSNLLGDGVNRAIGTNHTNTARATDPDPWPSVALMLTPPTDVKQLWTRAVISPPLTSQAGNTAQDLRAPGVFAVGDIDGDGDLDIVLSGEGDGNLYWLEQSPTHTWEAHTLLSAVDVTAVKIADLDGDGRAEIVFASFSQGGAQALSLVGP